MWTLVPVIKKNQIHFLKFSRAIQARAYYRDCYLDLITGKKIHFNLTKLEKEVKNISLQGQTVLPVVWHFFYELGELFIGEAKGIPMDVILAIEIQYSACDDWDIDSKSVPQKLKATKVPKLQNYSKKFKVIRTKLLSGNIYQANLTERFQFQHLVTNEAKALAFCSHLWRETKKIAAYAHASYIPGLQKLFFSNSPECLFQIKNYSAHRLLWTMPIKGTLPLAESEDKEKIWQKLKNDQKNSAELLMICDLLWNDLNRIERPWARVERIKFPLAVNKILHQASLISVRLSFKVNFLTILSSLFPGGSVTGAPKKSSMKILKNLEERRGFYCGSTLISYGEIFAASINIRSLTMDMKNLTAEYGAGGGITVHSKLNEEFSEMLLKVESFLGLN